MKKLAVLAGARSAASHPPAKRRARACPGRETKPRLVVRELSVGFTDPPDPDLPPGPCINFKVALAAVTGRDAHPYPQGVITIDGTIEDEAADELVRGRFSTEGHRGAAVIAGTASRSAGEHRSLLGSPRHPHEFPHGRSAGPAGLSCRTLPSATGAALRRAAAGAPSGRIVRRAIPPVDPRI